MNIIKNNFIIITGGPGGGKSTLLESLSRQGFRYIPETGRAIIAERVNKGLTPRPGLKEFAKEMFERDITHYLANQHIADTLFFDRSFLDSASLMHQVDKMSFKIISEVLQTYRFNERVFITPPWKEIYCNDNERDQTFEEAIEVYERLHHWYELNNYKVVVLPKSAVEDRSRFVLNKIS